MKSRTSSFNTALRKSITRFAPCWVLYTIGLVMILLLMMQESNYWKVGNIAQWIVVMPIMNLFYALLTAQLLFGDLFSSRMCNALHAMPLRREGWYTANVTAGILFSLIPTLITALIAIPFCVGNQFVQCWQVPLLWLLGSNLSYICFFGIAVFCIHLTGNRFAMVVVYSILNFAAVILYWLVDTLYTPMLYGVRTQADPFFRLTPVVHMASTEYVDVYRENMDIIYSDILFTCSDDWAILAIWAAVGIAALGLALVLYRKRKLECAGDFMAFRFMEPVFLIVYTLIVGTCFQFFASNLIGFYGDLVYLFVGLGVGWFTGLMLIKRTIRVFRWKSIGGCALAMILMGISLALTTFDVFGIARWLPEESEIKSAYVYMGHAGNDNIPEHAVEITDPEDLQALLRVHEISREPQEEPAFEPIPAKSYDGTDFFYEVQDTYFNFTLIYELNNGRRVYRYYGAYADTEAGQILHPWFSSIEAVLNLSEAELPSVVNRIYEVTLNGNMVYLTREQQKAMLDAIASDCRAGAMAQRRAFHIGECDGKYFSLGFSYVTDGGLHYWQDVNVYDCCRNVQQWIEENDLADLLEEYGGKY